MFALRGFFGTSSGKSAFIEQAGIVDRRTTTIGIGGHHYKHCAINIYFKTFVIPNYRRYNDLNRSIMKNHMAFCDDEGSRFVDSTQWHVALYIIPVTLNHHFTVDNPY